ncbi:hypothetical protein IMG5_037140 [Ichthyophthirius multifiliis]|uniref:Cilia-and flagella-associated protein 96 n=1 Tax=Ichthyophthirius multifiliis TaxID=5932 RepID=G0QLV3_ICHMU|nr:hypothetical protein IMG5_037140 [Ichthyophthirius multifiliis]EGR33803.1 hypothetical protein IMG5_037140 [Ichthyophthirius multifiliis]|eukprot:XP_004039027.1 hypothetical protein IMG5_037140 [Ichthyophthirius multifiliis]
MSEEKEQMIKTLRQKALQDTEKVAQAQRFALFSQPPPLAVGDDSLFQKKKFKKNENGKIETQPRNIQVSCPKKGKIKSSYFSLLGFTTIGDKYIDQDRIIKQDELNKKNLLSKIKYLNLQVHINQQQNQNMSIYQKQFIKQKIIKIMMEGSLLLQKIYLQVQQLKIYLNSHNIWLILMIEHVNQYLKKDQNILIFLKINPHLNPNLQEENLLQKTVNYMDLRDQYNLKHPKKQNLIFINMIILLNHQVLLKKVEEVQSEKFMNI